MRKDLFARYRIPPSFELHTTKFLNGRGSPSINPSWNASKVARQAVIEEALAVIGDADGPLRVGTVCRQTSSSGKEYARQRVDVYSKLVQHIDNRLEGADQLGMIFMDGDATETAYFGAHRSLELARRNVIEDPLFQAAHRSQWVQMADIAAYVAYQGLLRHEGKKFAWDWYSRYLRPIDVNGGPLYV